MLDFTDFYIIYKGHPKFNSTDIIEDEPIRVIVQKYEMVLFTNKGDVLGQPDFGADLEYLLNETRLSEENIESEIKTQIYKHIPELNNLDYTLTVSIYEDPERAQEYMEILFNISDYNVFTVVT